MESSWSNFSWRLGAGIFLWPCVKGMRRPPVTLLSCFSPNSGSLRGSYGKGKGRVLIEILAVTWWFRLRRNAVLRFYVDFDCAGSHKACAAEIAIYEGIVLPGVRVRFRT